MDLLNALKKESYKTAVGPYLSGPGFNKVLRRMPQVIAIQRAIDHKLINDDMIIQFISELMDEFLPDEEFKYDIALASLAVVLEKHPTSMATEFLTRLTELELSELSISRRVARYSLEEHNFYLSNLKKQEKL